MNEDKKIPQESNNVIAHFGTFDFTGKGPGTYCGGVVKFRANPKRDLLDSASSFLKAADRCLNGCKVEEGTEMLTVPGAVCASFSCELFLKYILLVENGEEVRGHDLADLFKKCSKEIQTALTERNTSILTILERNNTQFVEARYHHEKESISFCQQELLQAAELLSRFVAERYPNKKGKLKGACEE
jgi:HEPN domain-containing protein